MPGCFCQGREGQYNKCKITKGGCFMKKFNFIFSSDRINVLVGQFSLV